MVFWHQHIVIAVVVLVLLLCLPFPLPLLYKYYIKKLWVYCQYTPKFFNSMSLLIESDVTNSQVGLPCPLSHRLHISRQENHAGQPFSKQEFSFSIGRINSYNQNINTSLLISLVWNVPPEFLRSSIVVQIIVFG